MEHQHNEGCKEVFALLSDYLNLELPPEACQEIEAHIAGCEPCIEFTESLRKTVDLCRQYRPAELAGPLGDEAKSQLLEAYKKMLEARAGAPPEG
ncbi:MAG TPA: zf-HC2 domain-containing protein [Bryobacteraceae bacterium]|jgi:anti-sigma factor RsiW